MRCLSSAKLSMLVDVIKPSSAPTEGDTTGHWEYVQDPDSGAMVQVWVTDNPDTPGTEGHVLKGVRCLARSTGMRPEVWNAEYLNEEWVKLTVAANANITLRDKLTNIRTFKGQLIWTEEESDGNPATKFDVFRVSPVIDGFGNVVEKAVLAKRAEVQ
ncbi:hypothetical protein SEA_BILLNYE_28 [Streptomyces phage BillNye]|uniref:Uncharacterized protein n=1 Tax=Streptomyces phage BillNye TaxID=2079426 RepID=A0A2L1IVK3_9CAUD|nr:hypothetical protein FDJ30_gp203 [Streptomyces phage BillNye]AVD99230.1 hypothetical protein SEA_BILLNYE_28 [Streptomyces phage BillNye]